MFFHFTRYNIVFLAFTYGIPMIVMIICYSIMGRILWGSQSIGENTERQTESVKSKKKVSMEHLLCQYGTHPCSFARLLTRSNFFFFFFFGSVLSFYLLLFVVSWVVWCVRLCEWIWDGGKNDIVKMTNVISYLESDKRVLNTNFPIQICTQTILTLSHFFFFFIFVRTYEYLLNVMLCWSVFYS